MSFYVANPWGDSVDNPSLERVREFLENIDPADEEHGAAWISDDCERSLELSNDGTLTFDVGDAEPRHLAHVSVEKALDLWMKLADGRIAELESEPWCRGTRPQLSAQEASERERKRAETQRAIDREFYDLLGDERPEVPCRHHECRRGAIRQSIFCRAHHFESIRGRRSPFDD